MADSPHRSDVPDEAGDRAVPASAPPAPAASTAPTTAVDVEMPSLDGGAAGQDGPPAELPAQPWWMQAPADLTSGPQRIPDLAGTPGDVSTGPHALPTANGTLTSGGHPVVTSGGHPVVTSGGHPVVTSGGHPVVTSGGHPVVTSGAHPVVSTGPQRAVGAAQARSVQIASGQTPSGQASGEPAVKRRTTRRIVVIMALAASVGLVAALAVGAPALRQGGSGDGGTKAARHRITAAAVAGGLQRTPGMPAATAAYPFIASAVRAGGAERAGNVAAVYADLPQRSQNVVFLGGTGKIGDPAAFLRRARPSTVLTARNVKPGKGGGRGVCGTFAVLSDVHVYCSWATETSFGFVASNLPTVGDDTAAMADLMRRMRADLEK
ncbi:hypothetical protein [Actinomadura sp. NBRC 104425]|uniref:hypothetical protein n=1 Tax=Actinomadura sp. NBRC 104425 TaxID=3032204 RepID=UPI0025543E2D|nr:hypothetical protein [Actinomadura sp. NBRC 104425]